MHKVSQKYLHNYNHYFTINATKLGVSVDIVHSFPNNLGHKHTQAGKHHNTATFSKYKNMNKTLILLKECSYGQLSAQWQILRMLSYPVVYGNYFT